MILLRKKKAHGFGVRCEQICMLLPQRSQGSTLKNHMLLIANTTTVQAKQTLLALPTWPAPAKQPVAINKP